MCIKETKCLTQFNFEIPGKLSNPSKVDSHRKMEVKPGSRAYKLLVKPTEKLFLVS